MGAALYSNDMIDYDKIRKITWIKINVWSKLTLGRDENRGSTWVGLGVCYTAPELDWYMG